MTNIWVNIREVFLPYFVFFSCCTYTLICLTLTHVSLSLLLWVVWMQQKDRKFSFFVCLNVSCTSSFFLRSPSIPYLLTFVFYKFCWMKWRTVIKSLFSTLYTPRLSILLKTSNNSRHIWFHYVALVVTDTQ